MPDDSSDLEVFEISNSPNSTEANSENEGTNSSRFALIGLFNSDSAGAISGLDEHADQIGFNAEMMRVIQDNNRFELFHNYKLKSVQYLQENAAYWTQDEPDLSSLRKKAWGDLNEQNIGAGIAFLTAGLCSELEKESAVAAAALIGNLRVAAEGTAWRSPRVSQFWDLLYYNLVDASFLPRQIWPYARFRERQEEVSVQTLPENPVVWSPTEWAQLSRLLIERALQEFSRQSMFLHVLSDIAWMRTRMAQLSHDDTVKQFPRALLSRLNLRGVLDDFVQESSEDPSSTATSIHPNSTIVHGTFAASGNWWKPQGEFYQYMTNTHSYHFHENPNCFSWSGLPTRNARERGGVKFKDWQESILGRSDLKTVFAHSYGSEVLARAINAGAKVSEVVLLSGAINDEVESAVGKVKRAFDVRLSFDMFLAIANRQQRIFGTSQYQHSAVIPREHTHLGFRNYWEHSATHKSTYWEEENVAEEINL